MISDDMPVAALDARLSADRENEPLTGIVWLKAARDLGESLADEFLVLVPLARGS